MGDKTVLERLLTMERLTNNINTDNKSCYMDKMWHAVYPILREEYVLVGKTGNIDVATAKKFKGDLEGLLLSQFHIAKEYILPTMLVNGYINSQDYQGERLTFVFIDEVILSRYLHAFLRTEKMKAETN